MVFPEFALLEIDTTTGAATTINGASGIQSPHGGDIVPEPGTMALLGLGLFSMAALRRR